METPQTQALELKGNREVSKESWLRANELSPLPGLRPHPLPCIETGSSWSSEVLLCFRLTFYLWTGTRASHVRQ